MPLRLDIAYTLIALLIIAAGFAILRYRKVREEQRRIRYGKRRKR